MASKKVWITINFRDSNNAFVTGLTPLLTVYKVNDNSVVVNAQAMTEIAGGWYKYDFTSVYSSKEDYVFNVDGGAGLTTTRYISGATDLNDQVKDIYVDTKNNQAFLLKMNLDNN